jgi:hypothetical protein
MFRLANWKYACAVKTAPVNAPVTITTNCERNPISAICWITSFGRIVNIAEQPYALVFDIRTAKAPTQNRAKFDARPGRNIGAQGNAGAQCGGFDVVIIIGDSPGNERADALITRALVFRLGKRAECEEARNSGVGLRHGRGGETCQQNRRCESNQWRAAVSSDGHGTFRLQR